MDENELKLIIYFLWNDKPARTSIVIIFSLSLFLTLFINFLSGFAVFTAYLVGFILFHYAFKFHPDPNKILNFIKTKKRKPFITTLKSCHVCGDKKCNRHKPNTHLMQPWTGLDISEELDDSIEQFFNATLKEYVSNWYKELSPSDEHFIHELKICIRYSASIFLRRCLQVNLAEIIMNKLIPAGISYLDDYIAILNLCERQNINLEQGAIQYLGPRLHRAARNRESEINYLRSLMNQLLPDLLPPNHFNCSCFQEFIKEILSGWVLLPLMDILADPSIVNNLLLLLLDRREPLTEYPTDLLSPKAQFLSKFVTSSAPSSNKSALTYDISTILKDQSLLYPFMQFLKGEGSVNVLQFCLDVEEFNKKMITPELTRTDLENLYKEAWDLYSVYFNTKSPDHLNFGQQIVNGMHKVIKNSPENIVQLRTTPYLFQAYEYAYSILENILCPIFHQSEDFFTLLCGPRQTTSYSKSGNSSPLLQASPAKSRSTKKWSEGSTVAKISHKLNKIKGALKSQTIEGHTFDSDINLDLVETEFPEEDELTEDEPIGFRDLSAWRVSIPSLETKYDSNQKSYSVYKIIVQRIDVSSLDDPDLCHWTVNRRYTDFYILENKLTEFHGNFSDLQLPPKRLLFGPRGIQYMESKLKVFEEFLQRLLQKPALKGSDLLHTFLTCSDEFSTALSMGLGAGGASSGEGLGKMIKKTVPLRLRKERGQHLEPFLNALFGSAKIKYNKQEYKDINSELERKMRSFNHPIFEDNFHLPPAEGFAALASSPGGICIEDFYDCVLYLVARLLQAPTPVVRFLVSLRQPLHDTFNSLCTFYLERKLKRLLVPQRLAHLVRLLQGAIYDSKSPPTSSIELEARSLRALERMQNIFPRPIGLLFGTRYAKGLCMLFTAVQNPHLNKHLAYILLDIVALEIYPELAATGSISPISPK